MKLATADTILRNDAGVRSLGGYIGSPHGRDAWVKDKIADWAQRVLALVKTARQFPQKVFSGLIKSLQNKGIPPADHLGEGKPLHPNRASHQIGLPSSPVRPSHNKYDLRN